MFVYNVTFIHRDWCLSTTVSSPHKSYASETDGWVEIVQTARHKIRDASNLDVAELDIIDIAVDYEGQEINNV